MPFSTITFQVKTIYCVICNVHWRYISSDYIFFYLGNLSNLQVVAKHQRGPMLLFPSCFCFSAFQIQMCLHLNSLNRLPGKGHLWRESDLDEPLILAKAPCSSLPQRCRSELGKDEVWASVGSRPRWAYITGSCLSLSKHPWGYFCSKVFFIFLCFDLFWWSNDALHDW